MFGRDRVEASSGLARAAADSRSRYRQRRDRDRSSGRTAESRDFRNRHLLRRPDSGAAKCGDARRGGSNSFLQGDLFEAIRKVGAKFHLISSNPPYIRRGEIAELAPTVSRWEPRGALDGGPDGLDYYRRLAAVAMEYLLPNGAVIVEIGADMGVSVRALFANAAACVDATIDQDYSGQDRIVVARHRALLEN